MSQQKWIHDKPPVYHVGQDDRSWRELFEDIREYFIHAEPDPKERPLSSIVRLLREHHQCTSVLIGVPFEDADYRHDYFHHFGQSFQDFGRDCLRLHFFRGRELKQEDPVGDLEIIWKTPTRQSEAQAGDGKDSITYLGFMVIRPTRKSCIGRTIIQCPDSETGTIDIHARGTHRTYLYGHDYRQSGAPFMQQDRFSHRCGSVALWCLCYDLHRRYGTLRMFPSQITRIAKEQFTKPFTGRGLSPSQMVHVLSHIGCAVEMRAFDRIKAGGNAPKLFRDVVDEIYGYVQSNLPVLVGYRESGREEGHVVLVVGHDFHWDRSFVPNEAKQSFDGQLWSSDFVGSFICQDDQRGPYQTLRVWNESPKLPFVSQEDYDDSPILRTVGEIVVMPGLTGDAHMTYADARKEVRRLLLDVRAIVGGLASDLGDVTEVMADALASSFQQDLHETFLRLYIQQARRFRKQLCDEKRGRWELNRELRDVYLKMPLPKYVYVCDFCKAQSDAGEGRSLAHGEMLLDATAPPFAHEGSLLSLRLDSYLFVMNGPFKGCHKQEALYIAPRVPYNPED